MRYCENLYSKKKYWLMEIHKDKICYENRYLTRELDFEKSKEKISIEGKAGTLIIFDTDVWHQAGFVSKGVRRVMRGHTRVKIKTDQNFGLFKIVWRKIKNLYVHR